MGMTLEEALVASTLTAAASLDRADRVIHPATNGGTA
jgi:imidazolonepropionase-like amidohydrolase